MTPSNYQKLTATFALYPEYNELQYLSLGLAAEAGELAGHVAKFYRGDVNPIFEDLMKKELGDIMWFISQLCNANGWTIEEVMDENIAKLESRKERDVIRGSGDLR